MPKSLIWLIVLLVAIGLFATTSTRSPEKTNPSDRKQVTEKPAPPLTKVPSDGNIAIDATWLIEPGKRVGQITGSTTLADLERLYGKANVKAGPVPGPEGTTLQGAVLFPKDAHRTLTVIWKERSSPATAANVRMSGKETLWHTAEGITLGTTLKELEQLNGGPFTLSGFDWDYGGTILSWGDRGKLRDRFQSKGGLVLRLAPAKSVPQGIYEQVMGDQTFSSNTPAMHHVNPTVSEIIVMLQG